MENAVGITGKGFPYHILKDIEDLIIKGDKTMLSYELSNGKTIKFEAVSPDKDSMVLALYLNDDIETYYDYHNQPESDLKDKIATILEKAQS